MLNMLCTAVRLKYMSIDQVPSAFQADVKKELGIQDVVEEQPTETVVETPEEQPVEESPVETTPVAETNEQSTVSE
ncbi:hypothetical protein [Bacillus sp. Au-Bac7]|uniref:hypothetical protein n=1 Tax=Bacillus sp. Au-Bac7 TaxID=2906458 RepID=UPI001E33AFA7|nr:hypothetical protein [Bacillus sp. Au-Bac7]MCE4048010.1 hypothetical protein [Bacillus sp. Au-Bac7]